MDQRTDIWALGAVLHEMLTGRLPMGQTETLPEGLGRVVRKALAADPRERYQHVEDMLVDLRKWQAPPAPRSRRWVIAGAVATAAVAGAAGVWRWRAPSQGREPLTSLVVLPLENVGKDPSMEYLSDGIAESLINSLSHVRQLRVMARATAFRFKGRQSEPQAVGRELNVRAVLTGRLLRVGDGLAIQVDLVDTDQGTQLWGRRYDRDLGDILAIQDDVAREIADALRLELTPSERANLLKRYTENTEAYELYLRGRSYWNRRIGDSLKLAEAYFSRAIRVDPDYAMAYSGLADCYNVEIEYLIVRPRDVYPKALAAAREAVQLDDQLAEAHTSLAWALAQVREYASAEREFLRAVELNPHYPTAHHWYSMCLFRMGRTADALREIGRAGELDPLSFQIPAFRGRLLREDGEYNEAIEVLRKAQQLNPQYPFYYLRLSDVYLEQGRYQEAFEALQQYLKVDPTRQYYFLGRLYGRWGRHEEARQMLHGALGRWRESYYPPSFIAEVYLAMGEKDRAFEWLDTACAEQDYHFVPADRNWNPIRSDPRFEAVVRRIDTPIE